MTVSACLLDWDGTLREGFVILAWAEYLAANDKIAEHVPKSMKDSIEKHKANDSFTYEQMAEEVVNTFANSQKGLRASEIDALAKTFSASDSEVFSFAAPLVSQLRKSGIEPIVITGSPTNVVKCLAQKIGVSLCYGLELTVDDHGLFLGSYECNMALPQNKQARITRLSEKFSDLPLALGDSRSDVPLFNAARCAYFITKDPRKLNTDLQLSALVDDKKLRPASPKEMVHLVESNRILWR